MTYCVAALLDDGLVLASDTRTNAGVDHVATVRKMTVMDRPGDRVIVLLSAGNLAITQSVVSILREHDSTRGRPGSLFRAPTMFRAAQVVGEALREVERTDAEHLRRHGVDFSCAFILGGQIKGEAPRLFNIYSAGNFIEATPETPYFQIGEMKYGKPVLDRLLRFDMSLPEAAKCVLVSYTSTIRSNVSVGPPIDLACYRRDSLELEYRTSVAENDPYFRVLTEQWGGSLREAFDALPEPVFMSKKEPAKKRRVAA